MLQRQAGAGAHLDFIAFGDRDLESGGDRMALARHQVQFLRRHDIHPGRAVGCITWQGQILAMGKARDPNENGHASS